MLKALFSPRPRQTTGLIASLVTLAGLDWATPVFSASRRRQKRRVIPRRKNATPWKENTPRAYARKEAARANH